MLTMMPMAFTLAAALLQAAPPSFDYDKTRPLGVTVDGAPADRGAVNQSGDVRVRQISYAQLDGTRNHATLVLPPPAARGPHPAILYLHWYEPPRPTSNRTEFLAEAVDLAASGVVSLLVDTPWTAESWFAKRDAARDYAFTIQETKDVRRAINVLLAQPGLDPGRIAVVGHDFGAMWGALAVAADARVTQFVYMAGARSFSDWYLFTPKREGADKEAYIAMMAPLDPIAALAKISPRPILLQFGDKDTFVSTEALTAMADAVKGPRTVKTYPFEHELTYQARLDRMAWLREQFRLAKGPGNLVN
jgi:cephalosporin-C deacetylase-like acetyl esterase